MKNLPNNINYNEFIQDYMTFNSSYKVADKYNLSVYFVKTFLKQHNILNTQSKAASIRNLNNTNCGKYIRTEKHLNNLSNLAKQKIGPKNPFFGKKHSLEVKKQMSEFAIERVKDKNPNFKHGNYIRRPKDFRIKDFAPIKKEAFQRDNYTCQICKEKGGTLHAHHVLPYWVCEASYLDVQNLLTVCKNCHFKFAHNSNWQCFNVNLISVNLMKKYSFSAERLNELATIFSGCESLDSTNK